MAVHFPPVDPFSQAHYHPTGWGRHKVKYETMMRGRSRARSLVSGAQIHHGMKHNHGSD